MKKQTVYCALALSGALLLGSCASSIRHNITQAQARLLESEFNVVTNPIVGELDCMATVKMADSMEFYIGGFTNAETQIRPYLDEYKRYTVANYCMKHGYDVIVGPLF